MDPEVMVIKEYFTLFRATELELHHQMKFSVILRTLFFGEGGKRCYSSAEDAVSIF